MYIPLLFCSDTTRHVAFSTWLKQLLWTNRNVVGWSLASVLRRIMGWEKWRGCVPPAGIGSPSGSKRSGTIVHVRCIATSRYLLQLLGEWRPASSVPQWDYHRCTCRCWHLQRSAVCVCVMCRWDGSFLTSLNSTETLCMVTYGADISSCLQFSSP